MKLLRETIRRLILENDDELSHLLDMSRSSFAYYQQAKTMANDLGLNVDLEQEFLNLIKQEIDGFLVKVPFRMDPRKQTTFFSEMSDGEIRVGFRGFQYPKEVHATIFLGEDAIECHGTVNGLNNPREFDTVNDLVAHLKKEL